MDNIKTRKHSLRKNLGESNYFRNLAILFYAAFEMDAFWIIILIFDKVNRDGGLVTNKDGWLLLFPFVLFIIMAIIFIFIRRSFNRAIFLFFGILIASILMQIYREILSATAFISYLAIAGTSGIIIGIEGFSYLDRSLQKAESTKIYSQKETIFKACHKEIMFWMERSLFFALSLAAVFGTGMVILFSGNMNLINWIPKPGNMICIVITLGSIFFLIMISIAIWVFRPLYSLVRRIHSIMQVK